MCPAESNADLVHGTAVALGSKAALIRGPSGSGKSDLALRCIATPPIALTGGSVELVADDQVRLVLTPQGIEATPPPAIAGMIEVRGLGIVPLPHRPAALLALVVDLVHPDEVPRYPLDTSSATFFGRAVPILRVAPFEASSPIKLILALATAPDVSAPP